MSDENIADIVRQLDELKARLRVIETGEVAKGVSLIEHLDADAGAAAAFDFTGIPATFAKLVLDLHGRGTNASNSVDVRLTYNGDGSSIYDGLRLVGHATNLPVTGEEVAQAYSVPGSIVAASQAGWDTVHIEIIGYANINATKNYLSWYSLKYTTSTGNLYGGVGAGWYRSTNAISRITLTPSAGNFAQYSSANLYGVY